MVHTSGSGQIALRNAIFTFRLNLKMHYPDNTSNALIKAGMSSNEMEQKYKHIILEQKRWQSLDSLLKKNKMKKAQDGKLRMMKTSDGPKKGMPRKLNLVD